MVELNDILTHDGSRIVGEIIGDLELNVFHFLAPENEADLENWNLASSIAAVGLLALTCEHYRIKPLIRPETLHEWRNRYIGAFRRRTTTEDGDMSADISEPLGIAIEAFNHLERVVSQL